MNIEELKEEIAGLKLQLASKDRMILQLSELVDYFKRQKFGSKSEQVSSSQINLFNEAEFLITEPGNQENPDEEDTQEETATDESENKEKKTRNRGKRGKLPESLPREDVIIELDESERINPKDGSILKEIGEEVSERLKITPPKVTVIRTIRKKYASVTAEDFVKTAPLPPTILPKTNADATLLAFIICSKFNDHLPLYRQEDIFARFGINIDRGTMARWIIAVAEKVVPIINLLTDKLLESLYLQMDETTVQVLREKDRPAESKSYIWVRYMMDVSPIILFDYYPTRSSDVPVELLEGFKGHLQVDGYAGYNKFCEREGVVRLGCWDHVRRKFFDAFKTNSGKKVGKKGIVLIDKLYDIEKQIKEYPPELRYKIRQEKSLPVLREIKSWLDEIRHKVIPKSKGGEAVIYALNQWENIEKCFESGEFAISNQCVENAIRPFALGRRNWLFSTSADGARASATFYSLIVTAQANGLNPFDYLCNLFEKLPYAQTVDEFEALLPLKK